MSANATNSLGIRYLTSGPAGIRTKFNELIRALDYLYPRPTPDVLPRVSPQGTTYALRTPSGLTTVARAALGAFTLYEASEGATLKIGIVPGLVNAISPTFTDASPAGVLSDVPPPLLTITATRHFWLKCVGTFGTPDTYVVTVESSASSTVPAGTAITGTGFTSYLYIGYATVAGGAITAVLAQNNGSSWNVESYGSANLWWR
jgi:hypothetical protein